VRFLSVSCAKAGQLEEKVGRVARARFAFNTARLAFNMPSGVVISLGLGLRTGRCLQPSGAT
jgi:hypothetical protein